MSQGKGGGKKSTENSVVRDANLAAAVVGVASVLEEVLTKQGIDPSNAVQRLKGCQEIAFGCIPEKDKEHFGQTLAAIHAYREPPVEPATGG